jgi:hypothetical protein
VRRLITTLVVLLVLLVAADRIGVVVAGRAVAAKLRTSASLQSDPSVTIRGFPFLTQALQGRYDQIDVKTGPLKRGGVRLSRLDVSLRGVRLTLAQALSGSVTGVPVEGLSATAVVTYGDIASLGTLMGITIVPAGSLVRVTAHLTLMGQRVTAVSESSVRLAGRAVLITAQKLSVLGQSSGPLTRALAGRLDLRVPVGTLPYGLALTGVHVDKQGLILEARSGPTVIPVRAPV